MFSIFAALIFSAAVAAQTLQAESPTQIVQTQSVERSTSTQIPVSASHGEISARNAQHIDSVIQKAARLEQSCRWKESRDLLAQTLRKYPASKELQAHFSRAKILCDIQKRYVTRFHLEFARGMSEEQLHYFLKNFHQVFDRNFYRKVEPAQIFYRETAAMEISLQSSIFHEHVLPEQKMSALEEFRKEISSFRKRSVIQTRQELESAILELGKKFQENFGVNGAVLVLEGIAGFVDSLDPHSELLLPDQRQDLMSSMSGSMVGIGIELETKGRDTWVKTLIPNSPAAASSLRRGDRILAIDGTFISEWTEEQVLEKLSGETNTVVRLLAQTANLTPREIVLRRKEMTFSSIEYCGLLTNSPGTAYVRLSRFQKNSAREMEETLFRLQREGMKSLILDLRDNPGGTVNAAVEMADLFLDKGIILTIQDNHGKLSQYARSSKKWDLPLVVLINEKSASASEIFAGAIAENDRGKLVGARSFGKGTIQSILDIGKSPFCLKLTTAHFYSPNGNRYNYVGVSPNYSVHQTGKPMFETMRDQEWNAPAQKEERDLVLQTAMNMLEEDPLYPPAR
ncbi:MAG: S41 family peptidase [Planctomycetaceae bacterium]|nr:S41 family peptidase [Planctomycetaceae bacterium]